MVESLGLSRHPSKDYERLPKTSEPTNYGPMSLIMLGRLVEGVRPLPSSAQTYCLQNSL